MTPFPYSFPNNNATTELPMTFIYTWLNSIVDLDLPNIPLE